MLVTFCNIVLMPLFSLLSTSTDAHPTPLYTSMLFPHCFINTKKAFKKLYMFYFETFRIILDPSSVKKDGLRIIRKRLKIKHV